jgi:hypothetical protein
MCPCRMRSAALQDSFKPSVTAALGNESRPRHLCRKIDDTLADYSVAFIGEDGPAIGLLAFLILLFSIMRFTESRVDLKSKPSASAISLAKCGPGCFVKWLSINRSRSFRERSRTLRGSASLSLSLTASLGCASEQACPYHFLNLLILDSSQSHGNLIRLIFFRLCRDFRR